MVQSRDPLAEILEIDSKDNVLAISPGKEMGYLKQPISLLLEAYSVFLNKVI